MKPRLRQAARAAVRHFLFIFSGIGVLHVLICFGLVHGGMSNIEAGAVVAVVGTVVMVSHEWVFHGDAAPIQDHAATNGE